MLFAFDPDNLQESPTMKDLNTKSDQEKDLHATGEEKEGTLNALRP